MNAIPLVLSGDHGPARRDGSGLLVRDSCVLGSLILEEFGNI